jgi:ADP-ribosyl-[dinitrogen reductase] hydrolase
MLVRAGNCICGNFGEANNETIRRADGGFQAIADGSYLQKTRDEVRGSGYVVDALEAALWCFYQTDNYRDAVLLAANLGDDADTTAAICGQVAGAYYGRDGLPVTWLDRVTGSADLHELSLRLLAPSR